jgi:hypothetical protein
MPDDAQGSTDGRETFRMFHAVVLGTLVALIAAFSVLSAVYR